MFATSLAAIINVCFKRDSSRELMVLLSIHSFIFSLIASTFPAFSEVKYFLGRQPFNGVPLGENSLKKKLCFGVNPFKYSITSKYGFSLSCSTIPIFIKPSNIGYTKRNKPQEVDGNDG